MQKQKKIISLFVGFFLLVQMQSCQKKSPLSKTTTTDLVNVFLGSSGDHGQMSPSASSPFNMMSMGPQTNPHIHTGYEYYAKEFLGFTTTRIEGVGCTGSGGNILFTPFLQDEQDPILIKKSEKANPGFYSVMFKNDIEAKMTVKQNFGIQHYTFPERNSSGLNIDLSFALSNRFVAEEHTITGSSISGWIDTKTTCSRGVYRIYYTMHISNVQSIKEQENHKLITKRVDLTKPIEVRLGFSSVNTEYANQRIEDITFEHLQSETTNQWDTLLNQVQVKGEADRVSLFYSLLYRGLQSPYLISEKDGIYSAIDGTIQNGTHKLYNGWAIWDNYREQLPMLSLLYQLQFADISKSIANLYRFGKNDWGTMHEPSPTVRTEHALVVLLDAVKKGYIIDLQSIKDSLLAEANKLNYNAPDKALESSYDNWAVSKLMEEIGDTVLSKQFLEKALDYQVYWKKDFADLSKNDIDRMQARGLYQGTILQYRWFVPFDLKGLQRLTGGETAFIEQLDQFFNGYNYNHANQPDLQVPGMYNATKQPWKSQKLFRNLLLDTVVQTYFNDNSKGIDPYIGRIYNNRPKAYLRTMDDDAGTMSSWFVMRSLGLSPANVGSPIYYLTAPIFKSVDISFPGNKTLHIKVKNYNKDHFYIKSVVLNGKEIQRNWLHQNELSAGGELLIETSESPNVEWGITNPWISEIE